MAESPAERRITLRLLSYWEKLRGERSMPSEHDLDPADLGDLWDHCFLIHVQRIGNPDYNFIYMGHAVADAYQSGLPPDCAMMPFQETSLIAGYSQVIETRRPLVEEGEFRNARNETVKFRQCLLPLGEGEEVIAIFGGIRFKIFPNDNEKQVDLD